LVIFEDGAELKITIEIKPPLLFGYNKSPFVFDQYVAVAEIKVCFYFRIS
jgi:hypothetical protein